MFSPPSSVRVFAAFFNISDCFEEVPYDGPIQQFPSPITGTGRLSEFSARTAKSCQLICQKEATCKYFTWVSSTKIISSINFKCFLKIAKQGSGDQGGGTKWLNKNKVVFDKIISGPKYCTVRKL